EVDAERGDGALGESPVLLIERRAVLISEALEKAGAIVRIEIVSANGRDGAAAVNVAAGDRARSPAVGVVDYGKLQARLVAAAGVVTARAFHDTPAIVHSALAGRHYVDLFVQALPHVGDVKEAGGHIERVPPRVSQSLRPDFSAMVRLANERIVGRNRVRVTVVNVEAQ